MEVVHVVRQYSPSVGGLEDAVRNLCKSLNKRPGIRARVVTLNRVFSNVGMTLPKNETIDGVEVTRINYTGSSRYPIAPAVLREIRDADLVHVHAIDFFFDFLALTTRLHRKPLVVSTHGGFFHSRFAQKLKKLWFQNITRLSASAYKFIFCSSANDESTFLQIAKHNVLTIENGVDIAKWRRKGSPVATKTMIFIGRWAENKRIPELIRLVQTLKELGFEWRLLIVGVKAFETIETLSACAAECGVSLQVDIHEGLNTQQIGELLGAASYIASASEYEGFGISAIEGISAGLVPMLSPIAPFAKILNGLGLGIVLDQNDLPRTARALENAHSQLSKDPASIQKRCEDFALAYDWDIVGGKFLEFYQKALPSLIFWESRCNSSNG